MNICGLEIIADKKLLPVKIFVGVTRRLCNSLLFSNPSKTLGIFYSSPLLSVGIVDEIMGIIFVQQPGLFVMFGKHAFSDEFVCKFSTDVSDVSRGARIFQVASARIDDSWRPMLRQDRSVCTKMLEHLFPEALNAQMPGSSTTSLGYDRNRVVQAAQSNWSVFVNRAGTLDKVFIGLKLTRTMLANIGKRPFEGFSTGVETTLNLLALLKSSRHESLRIGLALASSFTDDFSKELDLPVVKTGIFHSNEFSIEDNFCFEPKLPEFFNGRNFAKWIKTIGVERLCARAELHDYDDEIFCTSSKRAKPMPCFVSSSGGFCHISYCRHETDGSAYFSASSKFSHFVTHRRGSNFKNCLRFHLDLGLSACSFSPEQYEILARNCLTLPMWVSENPNPLSWEQNEVVCTALSAIHICTIWHTKKHALERPGRHQGAYEQILLAVMKEFKTRVGVEFDHVSLARDFFSNPSLEHDTDFNMSKVAFGEGVRFCVETGFS